CAIFYRRAERGNKFRCRTNSNACAPGKALTCKRCRYNHLVNLLTQSGSKLKSQAENQPSPVDKSIESPSCSTAFSPPTRLTSEKPLLERLKMHYKAMCTVRLNSEIYSQPDPPHPLKINLEDTPLYPATFKSINLGVRILMSASLDFGRNVFPEFAELPEKERWTLVVNFFYRFRIFEACYRSAKVFPDDAEKYLLNYCSYVTSQMFETFLNDAPRGNLPGVK
ncbi:hypothetical protein PFISCL1PPCAC_13132, partial [Pristionchus fissidentatus]